MNLQSWPVIFLAVVALMTAQARGADTGALPKAREVLDRSIKEMGGREEFLKITSQSAKGRFEMPAQGVGGDLELAAAKPARMVLTIDLGPIGKVMTGYNGEVGWMINPGTGPMLLEGKALEQTAAQADFYAALHDSSQYSSMQTVGKTNFDGHGCYELKLTRKNGDESREFYDVKSGLPRGVVAKQESPMGSVVVTTTLGEFKQFGSILFPTKMTQRMAGIEQVMTFETVRFDEVPDDKFNLPKEVKTLVDQKKQDFK